MVWKMMLLCCILILPLVNCYPTFQKKIPNGGIVPNPCRDPPTWLAVGHYNASVHTFIKNPFALDFRAANFTWTVDLCHKDSDHDGMSNGDELGDPNCTWRPGKTPPLANPVGHPGICEPVGDRRCGFQHFKCDCLEKCPHLFGHQ